MISNRCICTTSVLYITKQKYVTTKLAGNFMITIKFCLDFIYYTVLTQKRISSEVEVNKIGH